MNSKQLVVNSWLNWCLYFLVAFFVLAGCQGESERNLAPLETAVPTRQSPTEIPATEPTISEPIAQPAQTGTADAHVDFVRAVQADDGSWTFHVTVSHPDTGWEDYADGWDIVTPDGQILKQNESDTFTRLLLHPHETEQPFTRSQGNLIVPDGVTQLTVRAHDLVNGFGGNEVIVDLTAESGPNFEVETN